MNDSAKLLSLLRKNKKQGFHQLFIHYYLPLQHYATTLLNDPIDAEDITQELFTTLWEDKKLERVEPEKLKSYLFTAIRNRCYTHYKSRDILKSSISLVMVDHPIDESDNIYNSEEQIQQLYKAIDELPERTRIAIECIMVKKMRYKEAAEYMNISVNTIKYHIKEGMGRLRTIKKVLTLFFMNFCN